jgi:Spy/CpxP family protein refolding chaperone
MTKKVTILMLASLVLAGTNLPAKPAGEGRDMMRHARFGIHMAENNLFHGQMLLRFKEEIGLTPEQVSRIEKMQGLFQEAAIRKQADIKVEELKLQSHLKNEKADRKEMEKMIRKIAQMRTDLQIDQMNYLLDLKEVLTAEQLAKIESLKKEKRHHMMEGRKSRWDQRRNRSQSPRNR